MKKIILTTLALTSSLTFFGQEPGLDITNITRSLESGWRETDINWRGHSLIFGTKEGNYAHNVISMRPGGSNTGQLYSIFQMHQALSEGNQELRIRLHSNGYSYFNGGNVGIGLTNPESKLHVVGNTKLEGNLEVDGFSLPKTTRRLESGWGETDINWSGHSLIFGTKEGRYAHNVISMRPGGSSTGQLYSIFQMHQALSEGNQELRIRLHSNGYSYFNGGNVGIGTTNPDSELTVKGKIHCEEVKVDVAVPADYVFEKYYTGVSELKADYTMPTLAEVETYTKENHHLPNIPSAAEIKEEGLHLKEMTNLLLQKVEELTLYTIEQQKQIEQQQKMIESLNLKITN